MADQTPDLPWNLLTSNLHWTSPDHCNCGLKNLLPMHKENQSNNFNEFVKMLTGTLETHAVKERKKYPDHYDPPEDTDFIIDEALANKITPTVHRWYDLTFKAEAFKDEACNSCYNSHEDSCHCPPFPPYQKTAAAFCQPFGWPDCYKFFPQEKSGFFNCEIVKTLLIYGEMDPILRVCAHPSVAMEDWHSVQQCNCVSDDTAWNNLFFFALRTYLCLNVIYHSPGIWDITLDGPQRKDYRDTAFYQGTLRACTGRDISEVQTFPFRRFFGIEDRQFCTHDFSLKSLQSWEQMTSTIIKPKWSEKSTSLSNEHQVYGTIPFNEFLALECELPPPYLPNNSDVRYVQRVLYQKGLPLELVLDIMERADYTVKRKLKVAHDPLHPSNRDITNSFLAYCWQLMVYITMIKKELGMEDSPHNAIANYIIEFWNDPCDKMNKWYELQDGQYLFVKDVIKDGMYARGRGRGRARGRGRGRGR